jgi:hypothetical protein
VAFYDQFFNLLVSSTGSANSKSALTLLGFLLGSSDVALVADDDR